MIEHLKRKERSVARTVIIMVAIYVSHLGFQYSCYETWTNPATTTSCRSWTNYLNYFIHFAIPWLIRCAQRNFKGYFEKINQWLCKRGNRETTILGDPKGTDSRTGRNSPWEDTFNGLVQEPIYVLASDWAPILRHCIFCAQSAISFFPHSFPFADCHDSGKTVWLGADKHVLWKARGLWRCNLDICRIATTENVARWSNSVEETWFLKANACSKYK